MITRFQNHLPGRVKDRSAGAERHTKLQRVLVPVDFTLATLPALHFAGALAERFNSTICLLHVLEAHPFAMGGAALMLTKSDEEMTHDTVEQLIRLGRDELPASLAIKPQVRHGKAAREILNAAEMLDADLIVLATHGRSALRRLLWGSTASHVARHAQCPVLVIRCEDDSTAETVVWQETRGIAEGLRPQPGT